MGGIEEAERIIVDRCSGNVFHKAIQYDYAFYHPGEVNVEETFIKVGRIDLINEATRAFWEIKPVRYQTNPRCLPSQLERYRTGLRDLYEPGTSYFNPGDPVRYTPMGGFVLVAWQADEPGLIYYCIQGAPGCTPPTPRPAPAFAPAPSFADAPEVTTVVIRGVVTVGAGVALWKAWWAAKRLAPLCGPAAPVCVILL